MENSGGPEPSRWPSPPRRCKAQGGRCSHRDGHKGAHHFGDAKADSKFNNSLIAFAKAHPEEIHAMHAAAEAAGANRPGHRSDLSHETGSTLSTAASIAKRYDCSRATANRIKDAVIPKAEKLEQTTVEPAAPLPAEAAPEPEPEPPEVEPDEPWEVVNSKDGMRVERRGGVERLVVIATGQVLVPDLAAEEERDTIKREADKLAAVGAAPPPARKVTIPTTAVKSPERPAVIGEHLDKLRETARAFNEAVMQMKGPIFQNAEERELKIKQWKPAMAEVTKLTTLAFELVVEGEVRTAVPAMPATDASGPATDAEEKPDLDNPLEPNRRLH